MQRKIRKIRDTMKTTLFLLLMLCFCVLGSFGIARGAVWIVTPINQPTCNGVVMGTSEICDLTKNGVHVGSNTYSQQLSSQQITQTLDRILIGGAVLLIVGIPTLLAFNARKQKKKH